MKSILNKCLMLLAASAAFTSATAFAQANEQFVPALVYRTGPFAPNGVPWANGFIDDYAGIRISKTGRRFRIAQATVWNLLDERGIYSGQAAMFLRWEFL